MPAPPAMVTLISKAPEETFRMGRILGELLEGGDLIALTGELGSGKTTLTQGIARGLGIAEGYRITSPTFTIMNEYPGRLVLHHMDIYRLSGPADLGDIGYDDLLSERGVIVIEWAEKIREAIPTDALWVAMTYIDEQQRGIKISGTEMKMASVIKALTDGGF